MTATKLEMPRCSHIDAAGRGCKAWGTFGEGKVHFCRGHLPAGFLPGPIGKLVERDPATLPALTLVDGTPVKSQGSLL